MGHRLSRSITDYPFWTSSFRGSLAPEDRSGSQLPGLLFELQRMRPVGFKFPNSSILHDCAAFASLSIVWDTHLRHVANSKLKTRIPLGEPLFNVHLNVLESLMSLLRIFRNCLPSYHARILRVRRGHASFFYHRPYNSMDKAWSVKYGRD